MTGKGKMVTIAEVDLHSDPRSERTVILKEGGEANRHLTIVVGDAEFAAIAKEKGLIRSKRPLTHELCLSIIESLQAEFLRVEIFDLKDNTYYARIVLRAQGREHAIDSRPSDAIALALNRNRPIMVDEKLLGPVVVFEHIAEYKEFVWRVEF